MKKAKFFKVGLILSAVLVMTLSGCPQATLLKQWKKDTQNRTRQKT